MTAVLPPNTAAEARRILRRETFRTSRQRISAGLARMLRQAVTQRDDGKQANAEIFEPAKLSK